MGGIELSESEARPFRTVPPSPTRRIGESRSMGRVGMSESEARPFRTVPPSPTRRIGESR